MPYRIKIIFIDNFDSFSYNLVDELQILGAEVTVYRNDAAPEFILKKVQEFKKEGFNIIGVLSP